jgi:dTDP-4-amino-4,6-dideoxygalactose transaminase
VAEGRDALQVHLKEHGIQSVVYYPRTLPGQALYRGLGYDDSRLPVARRLANEVLSLPVHPGLSAGDLEQIVDAVNAWASSRATEAAG